MNGAGVGRVGWGGLVKAGMGGLDRVTYKDDENS